MYKFNWYKKHQSVSNFFKFFKKAVNKSVFKKLILSYVVLVVLLTVFLESISFFFFSSSYNEEIEKVHQKTLEQICNTINSDIIESVQHTAMNISTSFSNQTSNLYSFDDPKMGNETKIFNTYNYLVNSVNSQSDIISAIHIYYRNENLLISSSYGVKYLDESSRQAYLNMDWLKLLSQSKENKLWIDTRDVPINIESRKFTDCNSIFTYAKTYPIISGGISCSGIIAIDIKESALSNIIRKNVPIDYSNTFIINNAGEIISHSDKSKLYTMVLNQEDINNLISKNKDRNYSSTIGKVDNTPSYISFAKLPVSNWKIVNITPLSLLYRQTIIIHEILICICILAIIAGFIIAFLFSLNIYHPLADIMKVISRLLDKHDNEKQDAENEYTLINNVINDLSSKVNTLKVSLDNSKPIIKNNLLLALFNNQIVSETDLSPNTDILGVLLNYNYYFCMIVDFSINIVLNLSGENRSFVINDMIDLCKKQRNHDLYCEGVQLSNNQVGIIVGTMNEDINLFYKMAQELTSYSQSNLMLPCTISGGKYVKSLLNIFQSFNEAKLLLKYKYFQPGIFILSGDYIVNREKSIDKISEKFLVDFKDSLNQRDANKLSILLSQVCDLMKNGNHSAEHCQQVTIQLTSIFSSYVKEMKYESNSIESKNFNELYSKIENINDFKGFILTYAEYVFKFLAEQRNNRNSELINNVKVYLAEHLESDLSLNSVAEQFSMSPKYLSKLFKDELGENFTSFISKLRLEKARDLLTETSLPVQNIGYMTGFNSPAYFIKQFKSKYGYTPNEFRNNIA